MHPHQDPRRQPQRPVQRTSFPGAAGGVIPASAGPTIASAALGLLTHQPAVAQRGQVGGVHWELTGSTVPVLTLALPPDQGIVVDHPHLLGASPGVQIVQHAAPGHRRYESGLQVMLLRISGPGFAAVSHDELGPIQVVEVAAGTQIRVRQEHLLASTDGFSVRETVAYRGLSDSIHLHAQDNVELLTAGGDTQVAWIHGHGELFEIALGPGESFDVEPGAWVWMGASVSVEPWTQTLPEVPGAGPGQLHLERVTGPGRVAIQSSHIVTTSDQIS